MYALQGVTKPIQKYGNICILSFDHNITKLPDNNDVVTDGTIQLNKVIGYIPKSLIPKTSYIFSTGYVVSYGNPVKQASVRLGYSGGTDNHIAFTTDMVGYQSGYRALVNMVWIV
jgi:hypothetical protein